MSLKSDDSQALKPTDLVFILAIAGRIDAQSRIIAQKLDKDRSIYYGYAVCDSLSSSYSMFKYFFDIFASDKTNDAMHDMMMTPGGIIGITLESLFLVSFSVLAAVFDNETEDNYKKWIASAWPYFRDLMKGLKNAYKGWRSAIVAYGLLGGVDANYLIAPVGIILGIFAAANRLLVRYLVTEPRKLMMTANGQLKSEIRKLLSLTYEESRFYLHRIQRQENETRLFAYISVGTGGFIDGLYLYVGVLGLAVLASPLLFAMVALCVAYTVACVITRVYEEYDFQLRLLISQSKCKLEIIAKETETAYAQVLALQQKTNLSEQDLIQLKLLKTDIHYLLGQFESQRKLLSQQSTRTYFSTVLLGLKNGLYAYGALASILFLVGSILALSGVAFPPALLVISVTLGLVFIASFIIHSLIVNYKHLHKEPVKQPYDQLTELREKILLNLETDEFLEKNSFRQALDDGIMVDASPQSLVQEKSEIIRSIFSGCGKGQKFVGFAGNFFQEADEQGHYHDTRVMQVFSLFTAFLFGAILGLRALARGFGRTPLGQEQSAGNTSSERVIPIGLSKDYSAEVELSSLEKSKVKNATSRALKTDNPDLLAADIELEHHKIQGNAKEVSTTKAPRESIRQFKPQNDSQPHFDSSRSIFSFFKPKAPVVKPFPRSESDVSLSSRDFIPADTILGLG